MEKASSLNADDQALIRASKTNWSRHWDQVAKGPLPYRPGASGFKQFLRQCGGVELAWRLVLKEMDWPQGLRILEAGCGTGELSVRFVIRGNQVIFMDTSQSALECARKACSGAKNAAFIQASIFDLPFKGEGFDRAFNVGVLDHFSTAGRQQASGEMLRIVKPHGRVVVLTNDARSFIHPLVMRFALKRGRWPFGFKEGVRSLQTELNLSSKEFSVWEYGQGLISQFEFLHYLVPGRREVHKIFSRLFFIVSLPFSLLNKFPGQYLVTVVEKIRIAQQQHISEQHKT